MKLTIEIETEENNVTVRQAAELIQVIRAQPGVETASLIAVDNKPLGRKSGLPELPPTAPVEELIFDSKTKRGGL